MSLLTNKALTDQGKVLSVQLQEVNRRRDVGSFLV